jgi:hypothetical protein
MNRIPHEATPVKRGANDRCAYGALGGTFLMQRSIGQ